MKEIFANAGEIRDIRLVRRITTDKLHKGYGYVDFSSQEAVTKALSLDRTPIDGRPMFVSAYKPHEKGEKADFKFGTGLQKNKLFVRNVHYDVTKETLEVIYLDLQNDLVVETI